LDFAGRRLEEAEEEYDSALDKELMLADMAEMKLNDAMNNLPSMVQPSTKELMYEYVPSENKENTKKEPTPQKPIAKRRNVVQDEELLVLSDHGMCLSMHQPWASLLVSGIKLDEGRGWYSSHRGRLWIAAAKKETTETETQGIIEDHVDYLKSIGIHDYVLPTNYPVGCLLGCVDVKEVLSKEDYLEKYPNGSSAGAYVFVCKNPQELTLKLPVKGQHKIWKLDPTLHRTAKKAL